MSQADDAITAPIPDPDAMPPIGSAATSRDAPSEEEANSRPSARAWAMVLIGGLLAGLVGFGCGEFALRLFAPSTELPPGIRGDQTRAPREHARRVRVSQGRVAAMSYGSLGALLGLALGAAGGLARRSPRAASTAALIGSVLGTAAGAGATYMLVSVYHAFHVAPSAENAMQELCLALATHGGIWAAVGTAAGLALGLGLGKERVSRSVIGGFLGATLATVIYEFGGAIAFPLDKTVQPTAMAPGPRLLAHLAVALCVSAGALWAADNLTLYGRGERPSS
jgi:hypothetical protein